MENQKDLIDRLRDLNPLDDSSMGSVVISEDWIVVRDKLVDVNIECDKIKFFDCNINLALISANAFYINNSTLNGATLLGLPNMMCVCLIKCKVSNSRIVGTKQVDPKTSVIEKTYFYNSKIQSIKIDAESSVFYENTAIVDCAYSCFKACSFRSSKFDGCVRSITLYNCLIPDTLLIMDKSYIDMNIIGTDILNILFYNQPSLNRINMNSNLILEEASGLDNFNINIETTELSRKFIVGSNVVANSIKIKSITSINDGKKRSSAKILPLLDFGMLSKIKVGEIYHLDKFDPYDKKSIKFKL